MAGEWIEISVQVTREAVEAVAEILVENGARNGVAIQDPELINSVIRSVPVEECGLEYEENTEIVTVGAYYPADEEWQQRLQKIDEDFAAIEERIGKFRYGEILLRTVRETDWANEWKKYFHTTHVGERVVIRPTWEEYEAGENELVISLDPGMAFGTGTHNTTSMCIAWLQEIVQPGMTVFDVGTGSGILAMVSALCGASEVKAVDIDLVAVRTAAENIAANGLEKKIEVRQGDLLQGTEGEADIIIANILADIILLILPTIHDKLKQGGLFLSSGIIAHRVDDIVRAAGPNGLEVVEVREKGDWRAVLMKRIEHA